ncbi:MAG: glycoside hydrolase family 3 N-terminal domain-containing protein [bacterium]|nr:glycoside hydrolase family 3 N-terminal domain-containing protein [bacterium]
MIRINENAVQPFEVEHREQVRRLAAECTLLLKKDGTFPLHNASKIALYGNGARKTIKGGTGSGDVNVRHFSTIEEGLKNARFEITTTSWLDQYDLVFDTARQAFHNGIKKEAKQAGIPAMILAMGRVMQEPEYELPLDGEGEVAIYVLARNSGEGSDRTPTSGDMELTEAEKRDILALNEKYERFMLVLNVGGMVELSPVSEVKNILLLGQLGTPTGDVLADLLLGTSYPSGKLTMTWTNIEDYPSTEGFGDMNDTYYKEGIYVGYRYFDTVGKGVSYPFGYGLGYTEFEVVAKGMTADENEITLQVQVTNIGKTPGKEVVQVYYSAPSEKLDRPYQELAGFAKTKELQPKESCTLTVRFKTTDMAAYDEETASYLLEKGIYYIHVGNSSRHTKVCAGISIEQTTVVRKRKNICVGDKVKEQKPAVTTNFYKEEEQQRAQAKILSVDATKIITEEINYSSEAQEYHNNDKITWDQVKSGDKTVQQFAASLSNKELAYLCIGAFSDEVRKDSVIGAAAFGVAGAAGETTNRLDPSYDLESLVMADGPAGIRISPAYKVVNGEVRSTSSPVSEDMMELFDPEQMAKFQQEKPSEEECSAPEYYQYCVAIPIGTDLAQSFNVEVVNTCGDIVGAEMEQFGVHLWLAPALNIHRSPLCGRNFEYYSEDPLVSGLIAAAMTKGVQQHKGCGTTIKHFACNNQETNRYTSNSILSERALREIYLRGFEICVKEAQPHALMTSYNLINGEHSCTSKDVQTYVLRDEWGYQGIVMTDWYVTTTLMKNPASVHQEASAAGCVKAGNDLIMPGAASDLNDIMKALEDEAHPYHLTRAELQVCAIRMLNKIQMLCKDAASLTLV